jgi:hypothetical protein
VTRKPITYIITAGFAGAGEITAKTQHYNQGRLLQEISPGRPQIIDTDAMQRLRVALRDELRRHLKHYEKLPSNNGGARAYLRANARREREPEHA